MKPFSSLRIVLGSTMLAKYPEGGGHWACFLQYFLGLRDLGHDVYWLEILPSTQDASRDATLSAGYFELMDQFGLKDRSLLIHAYPGQESTLKNSRFIGTSCGHAAEIIKSTDLLWNFAASFRKPLLSEFKDRALIDVDPGHLQVSSLMCDMDLPDHEHFLSVGTKINDSDCEIPTLGVAWRSFVPVLYLPMWKVSTAERADAPFTSVTQWNWGELHLGGRVLSVSKRDAYLPYARLPLSADVPFELAANIGEHDPEDDRGLLSGNGWHIVDPHRVCGSPALYQQYISNALAEFSCAKPIYRTLKTGWFSDRSAAFLASGRPVLAEDTGFSEKLPTGKGLIAFRGSEEAIEGVRTIVDDYDRHCEWARELAEENFDHQRCLPRMLSACGY